MQDTNNQLIYVILNAKDTFNNYSYSVSYIMTQPNLNQAMSVKMFIG